MAPAETKQTNNENQKKNRIQVSNTKKPLFFYVNLAKRYLQQHNEIELSALGMAITTVVTIAEILKNNGFAKEKSIMTSTVGMKDQDKGRVVNKARIEIMLEKSEKFDSLMNTSHAAQNASAKEKVDANGKVEANGKVAADEKVEK
ncbi:Alba DNA/RNA-binding protein [Striga hermonthica]|uniref:Alba DNA/RNA-binding protein n=1 Tax=Striga hermonthica TaxID=68872 RepID=A0A9N7NV69_STRHE|nr:Alba DNA/RNA-binding protein [Striga hermonthica]